MVIQYLEVVTPDLDATCATLEKIHGVSFGEPVAVFGNARTANLTNGGRIGVRAPMRPDEEPVVRPYVLVDDIEAAVKAADAAGAEIAMPAMEIPENGKFAIYIQAAFSTASGNSESETLVLGQRAGLLRNQCAQRTVWSCTRCRTPFPSPNMNSASGVGINLVGAVERERAFRSE